MASLDPAPEVRPDVPLPVAPLVPLPVVPEVVPELPAPLVPLPELPEACANAAMGRASAMAAAMLFARICFFMREEDRAQNECTLQVPRCFARRESRKGM